MQETREISALFSLIDDPDEEVFSSVSSRIVDMGRAIIPNLEHLWENSPDESIQDRIEMLIHRLHYSDLVHDLKEWKDGAYHDLLLGSLLVAKFQYPELQTSPVLSEIEKIRRNVWLEMNSYLTPLEQANVITSIVYNYYSLRGNETCYNNPDDFLIHKVLQSKKGNAFSNGILYLILSELLDMPVRAIRIPNQFVLAFLHSDYDPAEARDHPEHQIHFYVDPSGGQLFSHREMDSYFKRIQVPATASYFKPLSHTQIIQMLIRELGKCFNSPDKEYKHQELVQLAALLED